MKIRDYNKYGLKPPTRAQRECAEREWEDWYPTEAEIAEAERVDRLCEEAVRKGWDFKSGRDGDGKFVFVSVAVRDNSRCLRTVYADTLEEAVSLLTPPRW